MALWLAVYNPAKLWISHICAQVAFVATCMALLNQQYGYVLLDLRKSQAFSQLAVSPLLHPLRWERSSMAEHMITLLGGAKSRNIQQWTGVARASEPVKDLHPEALLSWRAASFDS